MGQELFFKLLALSCTFPLEAFADLDMLCDRKYAAVVEEDL